MAASLGTARRNNTSHSKVVGGYARPLTDSGYSSLDDEHHLQTQLVCQAVGRRCSV